MKLRIAIWAAVGALVVALWSLYFASAHARPLGAMWILVDLTCPIALARHHHQLSVYLVVVINAATYALVGIVVETLWRRYKHPRSNGKLLSGASDR